jgi:hypothetical protein
LVIATGHAVIDELLCDPHMLVRPARLAASA